MTIHSTTLNTAKDKDFMTLFRQYFKGFSMEAPPALFDMIEKDTQTYDHKIIMLYEDTLPIGFCMFQIDTPENPWCMKVGAGDIRELFIVPTHRKQGHGSTLINQVKQYCLDKGVEEILLTSDAHESFWASNGFYPTGDIHPGNDGPIYRCVLDKITSTKDH